MNIKNTAHHQFEKHVAHYPEHIAVRYGEDSITYDELNKRANQLARYLQKEGVTPDMPIALALERSVDFLTTILAILKAGGAYLPIDPAQPESRLLFVLENSKAPILITQSAFKDKFTEYKGTLVLLDNDAELIHEQTTKNPQAVLSPEHLAYVIYTSGSTGAPKGVLIEHRSLINYCRWFAEYSECQMQDHIDFSSSPVFDMAITTSIVSLMLGLTIVMCDDEVKVDTHEYLRYLADSQMSVIKITPSYFKILLQETKSNFIELPHLKSIILGGENLPASECQDWIALYPEHALFNEYGPTETTVAVSVYKICKDNLAECTSVVPIGKTGHHMSFVILNEENHPVADGETGELFIGGICLARGYLNQPELTQKRFINNTINPEECPRLYKTGDLCRQRTDGHVEYLGRIDDQVKIRGFRVEPGEIEQHLATYPPFKTVAVVAKKDALNELRLVAYYILKEEEHHAPHSSQIREFLQHYVPDYMLPFAFVKVDTLPLTANGKLDKEALPFPELELSDHYLAPTTVMEKHLAKIWSEALGIKLIGLNYNFYELGGHSLLATRIVSQINNELDTSITLYDFYHAGCIAKLIPVIQNTKKIEKTYCPVTEAKYRDATKIPFNDFQFVLWMANTFEPKLKKLNIVARKRFQGQLNTTALNVAFQAVIKKHEALIYRLYKFQPAQKVQKNRLFQLTEINIDSFSEDDSEHTLNESMQNLVSFHPWPKNTAMIIAKLFHLRDDAAELQICLPHLISDDASVDIIFDDLSKFYLLYEKNAPIPEIKTDQQFKKYTFLEHQATANTLDQDIMFWEKYLSDASFFAIPEKHMITDMNAAKVPYSTYTELPKKAVTNLRRFCEKNHISINNGLCTIMALALRNCCGVLQDDAPYRMMNIVRSTRDNPAYDHSIGCFLRVDPVKIGLTGDVTLEGLAKQIRQSIIDASNYQQCPNLIKLSSTSTLNSKQKVLRKFLIDVMTPISTKLLRIPPMYSKILQRSLDRLLAFKKKQHFVVNLNVRTNFIEHQKKSNQFGLKPKYIKDYQPDLLAIDYVFEACFFYDDNQKSHYLVTSANLTPDFRKQIAQEVLHIMNDLSTQNLTRPKHESYQPV